MQALRRSFDNPNEWSSPFRYTAGLIFFGTPFRGRKGLTLEEIVKAVAQSNPDPHQIYKETMALSVEENPYLQDIVHRFTETRRVDHPIPLWCFYETKPSPIHKVYKYKGLEDEYVVPMESACLDTSKGVERHPLERNHYNLQKFPGPLDPGYLAVKYAIVSLTDNAKNYLRECSMKVDFEKFAVGLDLTSFPEATQFVAREEELSEMHKVLQDHSSRSCVTLHGLGGIGKTQLAITYAKRHQEKYTAIFWLNANTEDSLKLSFRDIAQQVLRHHPSTTVLSSVDQDEDLDQVVSAVKEWLDSSQNTKWLMIYDNYDNPKTPNNPDKLAVDIRQFLPRSDHGSIIITTRSSEVSQGTQIYIQKLLDVKEGLEIVSNMSKRKDIENDPDAIALVKELDGLPLALSTAGVYLKHVTTSFSDYLQLYNKSWLKLQTKSLRLYSYEDRTLYTTWQITFKRIQEQNPASAQLLKLWGYFHREDLWFDLLRHANSTDNEWILKLIEDELSFNEAITPLCIFGLVDQDRSLQQQVMARGYSVHSCVHSWIVFVLNKEWDKSLAHVALTCVASEVPGTNEKYWWLTQRRLLQHAIRQDFFIEDAKVDIDRLYWEFDNLGNLYSNQDKLAEAEVMYRRALEGCEKALGPDHTSTLGTVNNLGALYSDQGKLAEAEVMYLRALEGYEKVLEPDHTSTLETVNNLGTLYSDQGKLAKAEVMYRRALEGKEKALGPDHTSTLGTVHNLGDLYSDQGKLVEAEVMYLRALEGYEKALGPDHTSTLHTVHNLGDLYSDQGKLVEAEKMYLRALEGYEKALGPDHTSTLGTVHNLGILYKNQGKLVEAEKMYLRALEGYEKALGPDHTSTLHTVHNLGDLYSDQGKLVEAEKMYCRALKGYEKALGLELVSSYLPALHNMFAFGDLFSKTDRKDMAREMYNRALSGYTIVQGPFSKWGRQVDDRLQALEVASAESNCIVL
ncbi:hypothetical protein ACHAO1_011111 [Botrytis cinerea]